MLSIFETHLFCKCSNKFNHIFWKLFLTVVSVNNGRNQDAQGIINDTLDLYKLTLNELQAVHTQYRIFPLNGWIERPRFYPWCYNIFLRKNLATNCLSSKI